MHPRPSFYLLSLAVWRVPSGRPLLCPFKIYLFLYVPVAQLPVMISKYFLCSLNIACRWETRLGDLEEGEKRKWWAQGLRVIRRERGVAVTKETHRDKRQTGGVGQGGVESR